VRLLIPISAAPLLHRISEWYMVEHFIKANADRGWYYVLLPHGSVATFGTLPRTTILRAGCDNSYYFLRELGDFFSINDGQYIIDAAAPMTPQMATGVDLYSNIVPFARSPFSVSITVWQCMFWAFRDIRWQLAAAAYRNIFDSVDDYNTFRKWASNTFKPSVALDVLSRCKPITFGIRLHDIRKKALTMKKFERPTVLYGSRMNDLHKPEDAIDIIEKVYRMGSDFDLYVTTSDSSIPSSISNRVKAMGGITIAGCGQDRFHELMIRSHVGITTGKAAAATYGAEFIAAGTMVVAGKNQWLDMLKEKCADYPHLFSSNSDAVTKLRTILCDVDAAQAQFDESNYYDRIEASDMSYKHRERYEFFNDGIVPNKRRKTGGMRGQSRKFGMKTGRPEAFLKALSEIGGRGTLAEVVARLESGSVIVRKEQIGRWITRKLIHDLLMSNPAVTDLEDGPEPKYVLDDEVYREWLDSDPRIEGNGDVDVDVEEEDSGGIPPL